MIELRDRALLRDEVSAKFALEQAAGDHAFNQFWTEDRGGKPPNHCISAHLFKNEKRHFPDSHLNAIKLH